MEKNEYKILIVKNRYKKKLNLKKGIEWFSKYTPLKLSIEEISTDIDLKFRQVGNGTFTGGVVDNYMDFKQFVQPNKYHAVVLLYGNDCPFVRVSITENTPLYPDTDFVTVVKDTDGGKTFNHELIHCLFKRLARNGIKLNDPMDSYKNDGSLDSKDSNRTDALKLLAPYWNNLFVKQTPNTMTYKYFKDKEIVGLKPELVSLLDKARGIAGVPFSITSGYRDKKHNASVGGVEDSAHMTGYAVDIKCVTSDNRWKIINSLIEVGFTRIGVGETFVHADCDTSKPQDVIWTYY